MLTNLKHIEWHGGISAHPDRRQMPSQRALVEASLLRSVPIRTRWDERTHQAFGERTR